MNKEIAESSREVSETNKGGEEKKRRPTQRGSQGRREPYGIAEAIRTLFGLVKASNKRIKDARERLVAASKKNPEEVAEEFTEPIIEVLQARPEALEANRRLQQARDALEETALSLAIRQVKGEEVELEEPYAERILEVIYRKKLKELSEEEQRALKEAFQKAFKSETIKPYVAARENAAQEIVEAEEDWQAMKEASKEVKRIEKELEKLRQERLRTRGIIAALLKDEASEKDIEAVVEKARDLGIEDEELLRAFERAFQLLTLRLELLPKEEKRALRATLEKIKARRDKLRAEIERRRRKEEEKRREEQRKKEELQKAKNQLGKRLKSEEARELVSEMTTLGELDLLISRLREAIAATSDEKEKKKLEKDLELVRHLRERRARQLKKRVMEDPVLRAKYQELMLQLVPLKSELEGLLRDKKTWSQLTYEERAKIVRLLGEISKVYNEYRQVEGVEGADWREFLLLEQGRWTDKYSELLATIQIQEGEVEEQRKILREIFDSLLLIGESPQALYTSRIWNDLIRFLEHPKLDKQVRKEFRARMDMYRFSIALQTEPNIDSFKRLFLSGLFKPSTLSTLGEIDEFRRSFRLLNEVAFLNDKNKNPLIGATAKEREEAFRYLAREWLRREAKEAGREFNRNALTKLELFRAEVYIKEALTAFVVLRGCEIPNVARDWWWLHRLWQYYRRVTESEIGHPELSERLYNFPRVALSLDARGNPKETPAVYETSREKVSANPVSLGLLPPAYVLIEKGGLDLLEKAGYRIKEGDKEIWVFGKDGQYQKLRPGEWFVAQKEVEMNGEKVMAEVWFTKKVEEDQETGEQKKKLGAVLHVKNIDDEIFWHLADYVDEGRLTSIYSTGAGSIEEVRKIIEKKINNFFPPPEAVDVKLYQQELIAVLKELASAWGDHLPSIAATLATERKRRGDETLTEDDVRVPGALYQEDVMAHFAQVITEYYLGRIVPEVLESRIGMAPHIWASAVLRGFRASGLITRKQELEIEQRIWGKHIFGIIRKRAIMERVDDLLLPWRKPFRSMLLIGWLFFFLQQLFAQVKAGVEGK